jgi:hypothetical protein
MFIARRSLISGKGHVWDLPVTNDQLLAWQNGELIQKAMPNLTDDQREFVKTGIIPEEWAATFTEDES